MTFLMTAHKNKTILKDVYIKCSRNRHLKTDGSLTVSFHVKKQGFFFFQTVSVAPRNFISTAAFALWAEPLFFWNSAAISSKDFPLVSGTLKNVNRVKARSTPAKRKNT